MRRVGSELLSPVPVDTEVEVMDSWGVDLNSWTNDTVLLLLKYSHLHQTDRCITKIKNYMQKKSDL